MNVYLNLTHTLTHSATTAGLDSLIIQPKFPNMYLLHSKLNIIFHRDLKQVFDKDGFPHFNFDLAGRNYFFLSFLTSML